jgi:hypothetical protein
MHWARVIQGVRQFVAYCEPLLLKRLFFCHRNRSGNAVEETWDFDVSLSPRISRKHSAKLLHFFNV